MKDIQSCYYLSAGDQWRVVLRGDKVDYIHAVFVNVKTSMFFHWCWNRFIVAKVLYLNVQGYKQQRAFIIAQSPMESTARDFWKMVHDRKCGVIVMLCDLVEDGEVNICVFFVTL